MKFKRLLKRKQTNNLLTNLLLVLPLLLLYEIGAAFLDILNGADFITQTAVYLGGYQGFIALQIALLLIIISLAIYLHRRRQPISLSLYLPVLIESGIYALTMGSFIVFIMMDLLRVNPQLAAGTSSANFPQSSLGAKLVLSIGAGVHEELLFRLILMGSGVWLLEQIVNLRRWLAIFIALGASALIFSFAHHLGPMGEPLSLGPFVYRVLAGVFFGLLYQYRGFSIAVYTHALYDLYVLLIS